LQQKSLNFETFALALFPEWEGSKLIMFGRSKRKKNLSLLWYSKCDLWTSYGH